MAMGFPVGSPTPHYEDNEAVTNLVKAHSITPRLKHIDLPLYLLYHEHKLETYTVQKLGSRFIIPNYMTNPHSGPSLMRLSSWLYRYHYLSSLPD